MHNMTSWFSLIGGPILCDKQFQVPLDKYLVFFYSSYHSSDSRSLQIAYTIAWQDPWEPFYIAPNHVPLYDERFKQVMMHYLRKQCEYC